MIINESNISVETFNPPVNIAWIEDRVEVYWNDFTIYFNNITTEEQAGEVYYKFNFAWGPFE